MEPWTGAQCAFPVKAFYEKRWQYCDRSAWISKRVRDSSQLCCSIRPCHQDLGSKLRGYWFYTKEERWQCKIRRTLASDSPSDTQWQRAERCGLLSMASLTTAIFSGVRTVFTLPPFSFSVEPVASKFRTQVLIAWPDGTAQLRWIPNSLRKSRWAITKLPSFL